MEQLRDGELLEEIFFSRGRELTIAGDEDGLVGGKGVFGEGSVSELYFLTDQEREDFNKLYNAGNKEAAKAYLDGLHYSLLSSRARWLNYFNTERAADQNTGWLTTLESWAINPIAGTKATIATVLAALGNEEAANPNSGWYDQTRTVRDVRGVRGQIWGEGFQDAYAWLTGEKDNETARKAGEFFYGVGTSIGDNLVAVGIAGMGGGAGTAVGQAIVQIVMSTEATGTQMLENLESGKSPLESAITALGSGIIEAITEKYSIEALMSDPKSLAGFIAKNTFTEGAEEVASDLLNTVQDELASVIWGHKSEIMAEYDELYQQLIDGNMDPDEAAKQASGQVLKNYLANMRTDFAAGRAERLRNVGGKNGNQWHCQWSAGKERRTGREQERESGGYPGSGSGHRRG